MAITPRLAVQLRADEATLANYPFLHPARVLHFRTTVKIAAPNLTKPSIYTCEGMTIDLSPE